jgi:hypothetical protein
MFGSQANAEAFNSCLSSTTTSQTPFNIDDVRNGQQIATAELSSAAASVSLDGITDSAGVLVGLSIAVLVVAGLWGESRAESRLRTWPLKLQPSRSAQITASPLRVGSQYSFSSNSPRRWL